MSWPRKREFLYMAIAAFLAIEYAAFSTMDYQDHLIRQATRHERIAAPCAWIKQSGGPQATRLACVTAADLRGRQ